MGKQSHELAKALIAILTSWQGAERAITASQLSRFTGASTRRIRRTISRLVTEERIPIASSVQWPYGFYLITTAEEARGTLRQYWSRVREVAKRARALGRVVEERFGVNWQREFPFFDETER